MNLDDMLTKLSNPAIRALKNEGVDSLSMLTHYSEKELLSLHGLGKSSIPIIQKILAENGLSLKEK